MCLGNPYFTQIQHEPAALRAVASPKAGVPTVASAEALANAARINFYPLCFQNLAHSFATTRKLAPVFSCTYTLFCTLPECQLPRLQAVPNSFAKTPGWGYPPPLAKIHHDRWFSASSQRHLSATPSLSSGLSRLSSIACEDRHEPTLWHRACLVETRRLLRGAL